MTYQYQYGTPPYCNSRWNHRTRLEGGGCLVFEKVVLSATFVGLVEAAVMSDYHCYSGHLSTRV